MVSKLLLHLQRKEEDQHKSKQLIFESLSANLSQIYTRPDGVRRCQMLDIIVKLAQINFGNEDPILAVYNFLTRKLSKVPETNYSDKMSMFKLSGYNEYRATHIMTS